MVTHAEDLERPRVELFYDGSNSAANEGRGRLRETLGDLLDDVRTERVVALVGTDPARQQTALAELEKHNVTIEEVIVRLRKVCR